MFYLDFGPDIGAVDYVRVPVAGGLDGLLLPLPRKRTPADQEESIVVLIGLREDDMSALEADMMLNCWLI